MAQATDVLQGTLDLLILKAISLGPLHGWGISKRVQQLSKDALQIHQGSLYPALYRLESKGWIEGEWGASPVPGGRRVKYYALTAAGRDAFAEERANWRNVSKAIELVLKAT